MNNGRWKIVVTGICTLVGLAVTALWFQLGGYARADDLEENNERLEIVRLELESAKNRLDVARIERDAAKEERRTASIEREELRRTAAKIETSLSNIDTALKILLPKYGGARQRATEP